MNLVFITSSVEPAGQRRVAPITDLFQIGPFVVSSVAGGIIAAGILGVIGGMFRLDNPIGPGGAAEVIVVALMTVLVAGLQFRGRVSPLPQFHQQVPRKWLRWHRPLTASAYGFILGTGTFTHLRHASMYLLALAALVAPTLAAACALGGLYGAVRGATLLIAWVQMRRGRIPILRGLSQRDNVVLALAALPLPLAMAAQAMT
jgi:hypothetical protein